VFILIEYSWKVSIYALANILSRVVAFIVLMTWNLFCQCCKLYDMIQ